MNVFARTSAAPHLFGERRDAFELTVTNALTPCVDRGVLTEDYAFTLLTACRPSAGGGR
ncbi:hypothetical protein [Streptomyces caniscabiei]|uniref:Uncharacterized protein n=1 Tax=Streptomyces caniscabiei TaxID=2746961 RepID=A0ABU4MXL5_9ACTN|nr:hypothetical protein [Streptomyces caniscabiei]MBE4741441.1 hypothetical protein [Streptomyces caniscabiei]MBE4761585.1 hypothetical protein [Streptomyces caniscabiei]MBE4790003.1 hypothetical protein [Streptomyces caniscabiei]MBE4799234.1 hypothetical protein [Streptomyces caniscabiei]MDX2947653.1 hypothetical protein [Streptomyces caniscabiei]